MSNMESDAPVKSSASIIYLTDYRQSRNLLPVGHPLPTATPLINTLILFHQLAGLIAITFIISSTLKTLNECLKPFSTLNKVESTSPMSKLRLAYKRP